MMEFALGAVTAAELRQDGDEVVLTVAMVDMSLTPRGKRTKRKQEISVRSPFFFLVFFSLSPPVLLFSSSLPAQSS